ncbi:hypothetical protein MCUN1_001959 [Malassezia cuniculi]|uniref:Uncharacterized protein n=1 Tax=Malassezia cuniculi TaxID=948313 RepID=A0AAF0ERD5_9BASI|nr:hypothetical protein MCUN1_001959 [Malassezia cuniculi]
MSRPSSTRGLKRSSKSSSNHRRRPKLPLHSPRIEVRLAHELDSLLRLRLQVTRLLTGPLRLPRRQARRQLVSSSHMRRQLALHRRLPLHPLPFMLIKIDLEAETPHSLDGISPSSSSSSLVLHERPYPLENTDGQPALRGVQFGWAANAFSLELYAQPQGHAHLYPVPELERDPTVPSAPAAPLGAEDLPYSVYFPGSIRLSRVETGANAASLPWFVIRAYSWRILLRALAWYGKSIVSGHVNDTLHIEIGFVTPRKSDIKAPAHVSLAMCTGSPAQQRVRWEALEAYSKAGGSTLTTVSLAAHQLALPTDLVTLAQSLYSAPHLSNAPALRELKQAILRHDEFVEARSTFLSSCARSRSLTLAEELEFGFINNQLSLQADPTVPGSEAPKEDVDGGGHREYLLHRMRRRLARWQSSVPDEDELATWVTPFDLRHT